MYQIWPVTERAPLDEDALITLYRPTGPGLRVNFVASVDGAVEVDGRAGLAELRLDHLLCEGGPHLMGALTEADLVDEVCLTVPPMLAGAGAGRITAGAAPSVRDLALAHALCEEGTLLLRYVRNV